MNIIFDIEKSLNLKTAVALGNFDGLHIGHQYLISTMKKLAHDRGLTPSVFTFNNSTSTKFKTRKDYNILMSNEKKIGTLEKMGVDTLYAVDFNDEIMHMCPDEFIKKVIVDKLNAELVVVGFNFRFGFQAKGDVEYLKNIGSKFGFEVIVINPVTKNNNVVSSTYIRKLLKEGNIKEANELLGRPYVIAGNVIEGKGRGKELGFATANLKFDTDYLIPKFGVYKTVTVFNNKDHLSITNIGKNPTFNDVEFSAETHILDFNEDIYGKKIEIKFIDFLREEIRFNDKTQLIGQVLKDIESVRLEK